MDAAGSSPPARSSTRAAGRHTHRGGKKHRSPLRPHPPREKKPPPAPSTAPCAFGCGCWFGPNCAFTHSLEDYAKWKQKKEAKSTLIDLTAQEKKARLAGRSARRSALSVVSNTPPVGVDTGSTPVQVPEKTGAPKHTVPKNTVAPQEKAVQFPVQSPPAPAPPQPSSTSRIMKRFQSGTWVQAEFNPTFFQYYVKDDDTFSRSTQGKQLLQHGTGFRWWIPRACDEEHTAFAMEQPDSDPTSCLAQPKIDVIADICFTAEDIDRGRVEIRWDHLDL